MKKGKYAKVDDASFGNAASLTSLILGGKGELPPPLPSTLSDNRSIEVKQ